MKFELIDFTFKKYFLQFTVSFGILFFVLILATITYNELIVKHLVEDNNAINDLLKSEYESIGIGNYVTMLLMFPFLLAPLLAISVITTLITGQKILIFLLKLLRMDFVLIK